MRASVVTADMLEVAVSAKTAVTLVPVEFLAWICFISASSSSDDWAA